MEYFSKIVHNQFMNLDACGIHQCLVPWITVRLYHYWLSVLAGEDVKPRDLLQLFEMFLCSLLLI